MFVQILLVIVATLATVNAYSGVDLSVATTTADWDCLVKQHNTTYTVIRTYRNIGAIDTNSANSIRLAAEAGIKDIGVYIFPCVETSSYAVSHNVTCVSPEQQILDSVSYLAENKIVFKRSTEAVAKYPADVVVLTRFWLDIEDETPSKYYDADPVKNQDLIGKIVGQLEKLHIPVGIYATKTYWQNIMGNIEGYGKYPLWYSRYDGVDSFDFFVPFADFTEVKMKQTAGSSGFCSISQVDPDYREVENI